MSLVIFLIVFLIGLIIGSFSNCFIWRFYCNESLWGRSYCPTCREKIFWYDNIPVLSFIFLKGKCRKCKKKISFQYPLVELTFGFLFLISFYLNYQKIIIEPISYYNSFLLFESEFLLYLIRDFFIIFVMVVIFIYDFKWMLIPDKIILPASCLVLILNLFLGFEPINILIVAIAGFLFFFLQFVVSSGKWIGGGDMRLGLFMGIALGDLRLLTLSIVLAYFIGSIFGIWLIAAKKKKWQSKIPLGVFLTFSVIITMFFGEEIINWYVNLF